MTVNANGTWGEQLEIASINLKLSDLELTASRFAGFSTGGAQPATQQPLTAQIDSNSFNLANLSPMITAAAAYGVAGMSEVHGAVKLGNNAPAIDGSVTLKQVALKPPSWQSGVSDLNGIGSVRQRRRNDRADQLHLRFRARESSKDESNR